MPTERIVHRFPAPDPFRTRLVAIDVTDPSIHARCPYRIIRDGVGMHPAVLVELTRTQLLDLAGSIARELELGW